MTVQGYAYQLPALLPPTPWILVDHVEAGFADGSTGHAVALPQGLTAVAGAIDVLFVGSDTTVSTPSGFTVGSTFVGNQGGYAFYRICSGGESATVTVTTAVNANTNVHFSRWGGGSGLDVAANAHVDGSGNTANPSVSTGTLATAADLVVTAAVMTDAVASNATNPVWAGGYGQIGVASSGTGASASVGFSAYRTGAGTAAETPSVAWTGSMRNRYIFTLAFVAGTSPAGLVVAPNTVAISAAASARIASARPNWVTVRSTLADPPVLTTPAPLIVSTAAKRPVGPPIILRSGTEDAAVVTATTAAPIVVAAPNRRLSVGRPIITRGSLEDLATPAPLVIVPAGRRQPSSVIVLRATTEDPPQLTTPRPVVITTTTRPLINPPSILRSSLADVAPTARATSTPSVTAERTSAAGVVANRTSTPGVT